MNASMEMSLVTKMQVALIHKARTTVTVKMVSLGTGKLTAQVHYTTC